MTAQTPTAGADFNKPAHFVVTTDVVNEDVPAFTATIGSFGNTLLKNGGAFEPVNFRNRYFATRDSEDRIHANNISGFDTYREGFLDGAEVRVYRIVDGKMTIVRRDRIAEGGFAASDWRGNTNRLVSAGKTEFVWKWAGITRPDVPYYFAVQAVDTAGNVSEPSNHVSFMRPDVVGGQGSATKPFKAQRNTSDSTPPAAPTNLTGEIQEDGSLKLTWEASAADDLAGYAIRYSDYDPENHRGEYMQLEGKAASEDENIRKGDMIFVAKKFYDGSRKKYHSNRVWGANRHNRDTLPGLVNFYPDEDPNKTWKLVQHDSDTPVEDPGETYLDIKLGEGTEHGLSIYNHAGSAQNWYEVLMPDTPYVVEFWMKYDGPGTPKVTFLLSGIHSQKVAPIDFAPTGEWAKYQANFSVPSVPDSSQASQMILTMSGPGTYSIDNYRIYQGDTEFLDYFARDYERISRSGMISLRTHGPIKTRTTTYSMEQFTNPGGVIENISKTNTLPQQFKMMRKADVIPWLQIEFHMTPEEWLGFVEYIAAPYDPASDTPEAKPWAHKRFAQGQAKPWTDEFEEIWFEIGNETWNWLFNPWVFEAMPDAATGQNVQRGKVYGLFQEHVRDVMRSSPYWTAELDDKFEFMIGGWRHQNFSEQAASTTPSSAHIMHAAYNGGWDEGEGPASTTPASYFNILAQVNQTAEPAARYLLSLVEEASAAHGGQQFPGTYEAGPGYALNGLNNARVTPQQAQEQEEAMKSLTGGVATLDSFLIRAYYGHKIQNFFTYGEGDRWKSHAEWYHGGHAYPCWEVLEIFNKVGTGDILRIETESVPTADLAGFKRRQAVDDAPMVAAYASRKDDRLTLFLISRKIPNFPNEGDAGFTPMTLKLPFTQAQSFTGYRMSGDHTAHNLYSYDVSFGEGVTSGGGTFDGELKINQFVGADERGLPPATILVLVFEGANMPEGQTIDPVALLSDTN
ncbi:MAG: hypothetical protein ACFBZ8_00810 [Opitutales bacterium]